MTDKQGQNYQDIIYQVTPERYAQEQGPPPPDMERLVLLYAVNLDRLSPAAQRVARGVTAVAEQEPASQVLIRPYAGQPQLLVWQWDDLGIAETPEAYLERHVQAMLQEGEIAHVALEPMPWLDAQALAERLGLHRRQVIRLCASGVFPSATKRGGGWHVRLEDLPLAADRPTPGRPAKLKVYVAVDTAGEHLASVEAYDKAEARKLLRDKLAQGDRAAREGWDAAGEKVRRLRRPRGRS